jgi:hypothetical protein
LILSLLSTALVMATLIASAVSWRWALGGPSEVRAVDAPQAIEQPAALPSTDAAAGLPPQLIDPTTGQKVWWSVGGPLQVSTDVLTRVGRVNDDTKCPNGEECPDPHAP